MIWPVGDQLGDAAAGDHQDQRRDDRLDADARRPGSRSTAPSTSAAPSASADRDERRRPTLFWSAEPADVQAGDGAGDRDDRADRQVDAAGGDDERHARARPASAGAPLRRMSIEAAVEVPVLHARWRRSRWRKTTLTQQQHDQRRRTRPEAGGGTRSTRAVAVAIGASASMRSARDGLHDARRRRRRRWRARRPSAGRAARRRGALRRSTSSSSAEMNSTAMPSSASSTTSFWISALAPTSMPRVGSSRISSRGSVISQRASSTFCWLPPERLRTGAVRVGRADVERLDVLGDQLVLRGGAGSAGPSRGRPAARG